MTTQVNVAGQDGGAKPITLRADQNTDNSLAMHVVPEVGGASITDANPLPTAVPAVASVTTPVLANSLVLSAAPCTLYAINANATESGYLMLFDAAAAPEDGATEPRKVWCIPPPLPTIDCTFNPPLAMAAGAVLVFSSTGPFTKTTPGSAMAQLSGEIS